MRVLRAVLATGVAAIAGLGVATPASALKVKYDTQGAMAAPNALSVVEAQCPDRLKLTGGGASAGGAFEETKLQGSYPVDGEDPNSKADDAWRTVVWNTAATDRPIESQAICTKLKGKLRSELYSIGVSDPPKVKCEKDAIPTGGGVETGGTFAFPVDLHSSRPIDGKDNDSKPEGWFADGAANNGATPFAEIYAICMKKSDVRPKFRERSFSVDDGDQHSGTSLCRANESVLGLGGATNANNSALTSIFGADSTDNNTKLDNGTSVTVDNYKLARDISPEAFAVCLR